MSSSDYTALRKMTQLTVRQPSTWYNVNSTLNNDMDCFIVGNTGTTISYGPTGPTGSSGPALFTFNNINSSSDLLFPTSNYMIKTSDTILPYDVVITNEKYSTLVLSFQIKGNLTLLSAGVTLDRGSTFYYGFYFGPDYNNTINLHYIDGNNIAYNVPTGISASASDVYSLMITNRTVIFLINNVQITLPNTVIPFVVIRSDNGSRSFSVYFKLESNNNTVTNISVYPIMQGFTGPQGPPGLSITGPKGDQGIQGIQGIQGLRGEPGPAGPPGSAGAAGAAGAPGGNYGGCGGAGGGPGTTGSTGPTGLRGHTGSQGSDGTSTNTGATGPVGPQGPPSDTVTYTMQIYYKVSNNSPQNSLKIADISHNFSSNFSIYFNNDTITNTNIYIYNSSITNVNMNYLLLPRSVTSLFAYANETIQLNTLNPYYYWNTNRIWGSTPLGLANTVPNLTTINRTCYCSTNQHPEDITLNNVRTYTPSLSTPIYTGDVESFIGNYITITGMYNKLTSSTATLLPKESGPIETYSGESIYINLVTLYLTFNSSIC